jgi:MFS family permease
MFSILHAVCGSARRAMSIAVLFFFSNLLGLGLGPLITGTLSDRFTHEFGPVGLRFALMAACLFLLPAAVTLWITASAAERDHEA